MPSSRFFFAIRTEEIAQKRSAIDSKALVSRGDT